MSEVALPVKADPEGARPADVPADVGHGVQAGAPVGAGRAPQAGVAGGMQAGARLDPGSGACAGAPAEFPLAAPAELALAMVALRAYAARLGEGLGAGRGGRAQRWTRAALLPRAVPAEAFLRPVARLCVAEPGRRRQVLVLRALFARRSAVRRCIDRASLSAMGIAVGGAALLTQLRGAAADDGETALALPATLDADTLAADGLARLVAGEPAAAELAAIAGYPSGPAPADYSQGQGGQYLAAGNAPSARRHQDATLEATRTENERFFQRLSQWMPEQP